jgi:hypothetical protein
MAQRRFGPTLGAGVAVIEKQAARLIDAAPLGVTLYVTPLEKGATDKVILTRTVPIANDATLNISLSNGTCTGITTAATSAR